jgi:hypothetical protein
MVVAEVLEVRGDTLLIDMQVMAVKEFLLILLAPLLGMLVVVAAANIMIILVLLV